MAINKNFVISNGLEVSEDLIYADSDTRRVGINSQIPNVELDVIGDVSFTGALSVGGTTGSVGAYLESTGEGVQWRVLPTLRVVERYTATEGQSIFPDVGFFPFESAEFIDVFVDGVKLAQDEYNTLVGNNRIELIAPAIAGETIEIVAYNASTVAAGYTGIQGLTVAEDGVIVGLSDGVKLLNFVGAYITAIGSGAGVTVFLDDRLAQDTNFWISNVSGLSTTTNVGIKNTSPARTLDVTGDARITSGLEAGSVFSSGVSTFSDVVIGGATTELVVTGDARITGILTIGTSSITIDGIRNEIKIGTALTLNQSGNAYVSGILTAQAFNGDGTNVSNVDSVTLAGLSSDSFIRSDANDSFTGTLSGTGSINISGVATASRVSATTGTITNLTGTNVSYSGIGTVGSLNIGSNQVISSGRQLQNIASLDATTTATIESAIANAPNTFTDLNVSGVGTIATLDATIGTIDSLSGTDINISGVVTATSFSGSGANVTGISTLNIVDYGIGLSGAGGGESYWEKTSVGINTFSNVGIGTTNPTSALTVQGDVRVSGVVTAASFGSVNGTQLNISGVTTISSGRIQADASANLRFGNVAAGSGSGRNIAIGDQVLVSLSGGLGRNIGIGELSYHDTSTGQYNIGIGERAGQKVTTGAYNVILGAYDGNSDNLDIRTSSRNVVIADGEGNIRQYINSSGNVGIKTTVITEALTVAGIVSATGFYGNLNAGQLTGSLPAIDGSALIGVVGSGSGVVIEDDTTPVGTAGTINFGSNLSVSFASGIATVSGASSVSEATTAYALAGTPNVSLGNVTAGITTIGGKITLNPTLNNTVLEINNTSISQFEGSLLRLKNTTGTGLFHANTSPGGGPKYFQISQLDSSDNFVKQLAIYNYGSEEWAFFAGSAGNVQIFMSQNGVGIGTTNVTSKLTVSGDTLISGVVTATSFSGSASGLTNIPSGQLTGALPAIDGSALLNVTAAGTGVAIHDDQVNVGSATTIDFGTGLDVTFSAGIATITSSGGSLQSRTTVTGVTTSIANNGIGNTDITGFKSYALLKVGLSTAGWLRLYTDSTSRANDVSRSVGEDPAPGSGVIAEVVTTGISTTQIISPFVMGGNLDEPADTTIYASITNLSGSTQAITANLTILQLEA